MADKSRQRESDDEEEEAAEALDSPVSEELRDEGPASPSSPPAGPPSCPNRAPASRSPASRTPSSPGQDSSPSSSGVNLFANDGSFLELFKKKMEQKAAGKGEEPRPTAEAVPEPEKRRPIGFVGKRRGGAKLALKTGIVAKKPKTDEEEVLSNKGGAWAQYMAEVKKYKAHQCSDDDKTRPLVK
ncbi:telomerase RNA component interacting RNase [Pelobates fuscus]|uniref:telomerase RNA component interacting RNase n=1 Tax=Pelobates fuscus TaxID=191477 RepID=UPI002FE46058